MRERHEQALLLFIREANTSVTHSETEYRVAFTFVRKFNGKHDLAALREFDGIATQIGQNLSQPQWVTCEHRWDIGFHLEEQFKLFVFRPKTYDVGQLLQDILQSEIHGFQFKLASFDLGEIKDVIDDAQQPFSRPMDLLNVVSLLGCEVSLQRQIRHANDRVHWCSDFMAHIGQEITLGLIGDVSGLFGVSQLSDVGDGANQAARRPIQILEALDAVQGVVRLAICKGNGHDLLKVPGRGNGLLVFCLVGNTVCFRQILKIEHLLADQVLAIHRKGLLVGLVEPKETRVRSLVKNRGGNGVNQCLLKMQLVAQLQGLFLPQSVIAEDQYDQIGNHQGGHEATCGHGDPAGHRCDGIQRRCIDQSPCARWIVPVNGLADDNNALARQGPESTCSSGDGLDVRRIVEDASILGSCTQFLQIGVLGVTDNTE